MKKPCQRHLSGEKEENRKKNNGEFLMKQVRHHGKLEVRKKNDLQEKTFGVHFVSEKLSLLVVERRCFNVH